MRPTPRPEQGRLQWAVVVDLSSVPDGGGAREVLTVHLGMPGRQVTIRFGERTPVDLDQRVPGLLAEAVRAGVVMTIEGGPQSVRAWWDAIGDYLAPRLVERPPAPRRRNRHLRVVR